jgi:hypothetical protein
MARAARRTISSAASRRLLVYHTHADAKPSRKVAQHADLAGAPGEKLQKPCAGRCLVQIREQRAIIAAEHG